jgi:Ig-like domain from next to BRCA1 gene
MKTPMLLGSMAGLLLLISCAPAPSAPTPDIGLIQTSAAQTVVSNFTLTALVTDTPIPTATATQTLPAVSGTPVTLTPTLLPGGVTATPLLCDALIYDAKTVDVNVPDNTSMQLGQEFVKTWRVRNNGSCTWGAGYGLVFSYGDRLAGVAQPFTGAVAPNQEVEVSVNFTAPTKAGVYTSAWQMANASGIPFPRPIYVKIVVQ